MGCGISAKVLFCDLGGLGSGWSTFKCPTKASGAMIIHSCLCFDTHSRCNAAAMSSWGFQQRCVTVIGTYYMGKNMCPTCTEAAGQAQVQRYHITSNTWHSILQVYDMLRSHYSA